MNNHTAIERLFGILVCMHMRNQNIAPYGSARDLPRVAEMHAMLSGMKLLTRFVARAQRQQLVAVERDMNALIETVDGFYEILGPRHWIFTDHLLSVSGVRELLAASPDNEAAEAGVIQIIADQIRSPYWHLGLFDHEAMRARRVNTERARQHYLQEQWDSCALVLVTVMDGFVNDVEKVNRRGLHAREPEEMVAWDSVVGHHMGLTSVMRVFLKTFKRRHDQEVFELHRHGIVHGTVVNYNNQTVATKAWNMLAAIADWAAAIEKVSVVSEPKPTLRSIVTRICDRAEHSRYREKFQPFALVATDAGFDGLEAVQVALNFLVAWRAERWGIVADALPITGGTRVAPGRRAIEAKRIYEGARLGEFEITEVECPQACVAVIRGTATINGKSGPIEIRWICEGADGCLAKPGDTDAKWVLAIYPPDSFIRDE